MLTLCGGKEAIIESSQEYVFGRLRRYSKTCVKRPLEKDRKLAGLQDQLSLNAGIKELQKAPGSILQYF